VVKLLAVTSMNEPVLGPTVRWLEYRVCPFKSTATTNGLLYDLRVLP